MSNVPAGKTILANRPNHRRPTHCHVMQPHVASCGPINQWQTLFSRDSRMHCLWTTASEGKEPEAHSGSHKLDSNTVNTSLSVLCLKKEGRDTLGLLVACDSALWPSGLGILMRKVDPSSFLLQTWWQAFMLEKDFAEHLMSGEGLSHSEAVRSFHKNAIPFIPPIENIFMQIRVLNSTYSEYITKQG